MFLTINEVKNKFRMGRKTVISLARNGAVRHYYNGNRLMVSEEDIKKYIDESSERAKVNNKFSIEEKVNKLAAKRNLQSFISDTFQKSLTNG